MGTEPRAALQLFLRYNRAFDHPDVRCPPGHPRGIRKGLDRNMNALTERAPSGPAAGEVIDLPWAGEPRFRCFGCSPANPVGLALELRRLPGGEGRAEATFSENYASYPGIVHGGLISTVAD